MKKRIVSFVLAVCMTAALAGCSGSAAAPETSAAKEKTDTAGASAEKEETKASAAANGEKITLQYMTLSDGKLLEAERHIIENYMEKNPDVAVEITSVAGVDTFITALKAKFAAGEEPDLYMFQAGTRIREFAQAGLLKDITDEPYMDCYLEEDKAFNELNGRIYGVPMRFEWTGLYVNREVLAQYPGVEIPENFQELLAACQALRDQGLENPMILAGKNVNNVSQFDFQYLACVISNNNPKYYEQMLDGEIGFTDEMFVKMFEKFGQMKEYVSEDSLGVDTDEAVKRFIRGEGAFWVAHGNELTRMRELAGDEFDFVMVPTVLQDENEERVFNCGQAMALAVVESSEYPDQVRDLVAEFTSPEASNIFATEGKGMPAALGTEELPDPALEPCREWFASEKKVGHADLVWVPGIKDIMKEITQKWYMGDSIENVLKEWDAQHQRLLESNPDFIKNFVRSE